MNVVKCKKRDQLHGFLKKIHKEVYGVNKDVPFEIVEELFFPALGYLTLRQRIFFLDVVKGPSGDELALKYKIELGTVYFLKKKIKKKIIRFIFNYLKVEKLILEMKKGNLRDLQTIEKTKQGVSNSLQSFL